MIRIVVITPGMISEAERRSSFMPRLNNSILNGEGNLAGFVGQVAFEVLTGAACMNTYNYDCLLHGKKIEVKTKQRSVPPTVNYAADIPAFNTKQDCDYYAFVSILYNHSLAWVVGCMRPEEFYRRATLYKTGDVSNGFTHKCDSWEIEIKNLYDVQEIGKEKNQ